MQCPSCNSDNVQKLQLIYEGGTQKIDTTSVHSGAGYSTRGGFMVGGATSSTTGQSQSISAKKAAPPPKQSYKATVLLILAGLFLLIFADGFLFVMGFVSWGVSIILGIRASRYNAGPWKEAYNTWTRSWQCNKCGNIYAA